MSDATTNAIEPVARDVLDHMLASRGAMVDPFLLSIHLLERRALSSDDERLRERMFIKVMKIMKKLKKLGLVMRARNERGEKGGWVLTRLISCQPYS